MSKTSLRSSNGPLGPFYLLTCPHDSPIRIVLTGQKIERSKQTALRLTMPRTEGKSAPDEQGYKVKERGVQFNVPKDRDGRRHKKITDIHAQVIDSCIAVIISRRITLSRRCLFTSMRHLNQPVMPVTTLATTRARCFMLVVSAED